MTTFLQFVGLILVLLVGISIHRRRKKKSPDLSSVVYPDDPDWIEHIKNTRPPPKRWSWFRIVWASVIAIMLVLAVGERTLGSFTIFNTYLRADFDASTEGTIVESRRWHKRGWSSGVSGGSYHFHVGYFYSVGDTDYIGKLVDLNKHSRPATSRQEVADTVNQYPVGKDVTVYYDSSKPEFSVLENTGISISFLIMHVVIVCMIPFFIWLHFRVWRLKSAG